MQNKKSIYSTYTKVIYACFILVIFSIAVRLFVRNIIFEKLNITKPWMQYIVRGDAELKSALGDLEQTQNTSSAEPAEPSEQIKLVDYKELYPFYEESEQTKKMQKQSIKKQIADKKSSYKKPSFTKKIKKLENKIEQYTSNNLIFYTEALKLYSFIEKLSMPSIQKNDPIIYMKNGYLTGEVPFRNHDYIKHVAQSLKDFSLFTESYNIPFICMLAGTKVCPTDKQLPRFALEYSNENIDFLLQECNKLEVKTFDFRKAMIEDGLDWYKSYYKTDHHWTTQTAFYAAKKIATILNSDYNFNLDMSYFDSIKWTFKTYKDVMFGNQGKLATLANAQKEDFTIILPTFQTDFIATIPVNGTKKTGSFADALMQMDFFNTVINRTDYEHQNEERFAYHTSFLNNAELSTIINNKSTNGKKVLFLSDSFTWYLINFLACNSGIKQIDVLHSTVFSGSIKRYVEQTKPDIVIMLRWNANVGEIL